jgi:hypothetical protein
VERAGDRAGESVPLLLARASTDQLTDRSVPRRIPPQEAKATRVPYGVLDFYESRHAKARADELEWGDCANREIVSLHEHPAFGQVQHTSNPAAATGRPEPH